MVQQKQTWVRHSILEALYNKQFSHAQVIVENAFNILKKMFQELMIKSNLHVRFLSDVVICCYILHNMTLNGMDADINELMFQWEIENVGKMRRGVTQQFMNQIEKVNWSKIEIALHWDEISRVN
jgi:hypothetical protein